MTFRVLAGPGAKEGSRAPSKNAQRSSRVPAPKRCALQRASNAKPHACCRLQGCPGLHAPWPPPHVTPRTIWMPAAMSSLDRSIFEAFSPNWAKMDCGSSAQGRRALRWLGRGGHGWKCGHDRRHTGVLTSLMGICKLQVLKTKGEEGRKRSRQVGAHAHPPACAPPWPHHSSAQPAGSGPAGE